MHAALLAHLPAAALTRPPFVQYQGGLLFQGEGYKKGRLVDHPPYVAWQVEILSADVCVCGKGGGLVSHKPGRLAAVMAASVMTTSPSTPR